MKILKTVLIAVMLLAGVGVRAEGLKDQATNAAIADGATTFFGLATGAAEMNPLGAVIAIGVKPVLLHGVDKMPEGDRANAYAMASSMWSGAAANNVCVIASIVSGGAFAPACVALGVAWGMKSWSDTENERVFWNEGCPMLREYSGNPQLKCIYTAPAETTRVVATSGEVQAP